jgi:hypothetical protein
LLRSLSLLVFFILTTASALAQVPADSNPVQQQPDSIAQPPVITIDTPRTAPTVRRVPQRIDTSTTSPQPVDTIQQDSIPPVVAKDSFSMKPLFTEVWVADTSGPFAMQILKHHPYFDFKSKAFAVAAGKREFQGKEVLFYALTGFLLIFALLKQAFGKYFNDLFRVFFRTTLKQRQIREQLMQNPLPSLVFNIFFVASTGLYINFMLHYFDFSPELHPSLTAKQNFWLLYVYCCVGLAVIYTGKFIGLKLTGWLFNVSKAADSYLFIVFIINKVIGIFLLPFLILLAFTGEPVYTISLVLSWCGIGALLLYRFILGFTAIRNEVRFNLFHFFLYLCAFEITPLLLIYKLLLLVF